MVRLLSFGQFLLAGLSVVLCIVVGTVTMGYCETCNRQGPTALLVFQYLLFDAAVIYVMVKCRKWFDR